MLANWTNEYRRHGVQLVSLLLIVSFAFIPVRCDASAAPHSIFAPATMLNQVTDHTHHAASATTQNQAKMVPHHSPAQLTGDRAIVSHPHAQASNSTNHRASNSADPLQQHCSTSLAGGNDPQSQQPVGATLDLPTSSITPDSTSLQPAPGESLLLTFAPAAILSGISAPPDAPPPKAS